MFLHDQVLLDRVCCFFFQFSQNRDSIFRPSTWSMWASIEIDTVHRTNNIAESVNFQIQGVVKKKLSLDQLGNTSHLGFSN